MRRVLLCGTSLLISGLQASLSAEPELEVQWVEPQPERIRERISGWQPQVLILEAELLKSAVSLSLLQDFPWLKLVGIEIEDNRLVVFSGSAALEPTPADLLQVINA